MIQLHTRSLGDFCRFEKTVLSEVIAGYQTVMSTDDNSGVRRG